MGHPQLRSNDEGKKLVTPDGSVLGRVTRIRDGTVYVRPKEGLLVGCGSWISCREDDTFELDCSQVRKITETAVLLGEPPRLSMA